ncbi:hypothetical protein F5I97DRAFT_279532 [Phlebopus sp. FC_14]|nr:hypothetical protein F5I97DRAFT_279532 [Phlebopus sp. FC_14]
MDTPVVPYWFHVFFLSMLFVCYSLDKWFISDIYCWNLYVLLFSIGETLTLGGMTLNVRTRRTGRDSEHNGRSGGERNPHTLQYLMLASAPSKAKKPVLVG